MAVFLAVTVSLLVLVAAFAVDLGMQRVVRRDLQALADVVALDMVRALDGRAAKDYSAGELDHVRNLSVERNDDVLGETTPPTYELGVVGPSGEFRTAAAHEIPNAVRVTASGRVGFAFAGGSGGATRSAVAVAEPGACFSMGSYAARVRTGDSTILGPLLGILGSSVELDLADLRGLAEADITLLGLLNADLAAAGFDQVLDTRVSLADLYLAMAEVLRAESGQLAQIELLEQLGRLGLPGLDLVLSDILTIDMAGASALAAELNVLDLVTAAAFAANGETPLVAMPTIKVPGVIDLPAKVVVGQQPSITCGRIGKASGRSAQIDIHLGDPTKEEVALDSLLVGLRGQLDLRVGVSPAYATLTRVGCVDPDKHLDLSTQDGLLELEINLLLDVKILTIPLLFPGVSVAKVPVKVTMEPRRQPAGTVSVDYSGDDYSRPGRVGEDSLGVPQLQVDTSGLTAAGIPLGVVTQFILDPLLLPLVNGLVTTLDATVLSPLLDALGVNVAGADIYALPTPNCGVPVLRG